MTADVIGYSELKKKTYFIIIINIISKLISSFKLVKVFIPNK